MQNLFMKKSAKKTTNAGYLLDFQLLLRYSELNLDILTSLTCQHFLKQDQKEAEFIIIYCYCLMQTDRVVV